MDLSHFTRLDREQCGIMVGRIVDGQRIVEEVIPVRNVHPHPAYRYAISGQDLNKVIDRIRTTDQIVCGFLHTHVGLDSPDPTEEDMCGLDNVLTEMIGAVYHPRTGKLTFFTKIGIDNSVKVGSSGRS